MCSQTLHDNCSYFQVKVWFCVDMCVTFHTLGCLYACCYDHERLPVLESDLTQQREATLLLIKYSFCFLLLWGKQRHEGDRSHTCLHAHTLTNTHTHTCTNIGQKRGGRRKKVCFTGNYIIFFSGLSNTLSLPTSGCSDDNSSSFIFDKFPDSLWSGD